MSYNKIMTNLELVEKGKNIADNYKTLYVMGSFGAPLTSTNKKRYCNNHNYNKQATRTAMIKAASEDTFAFDCLGLFESIMWGWKGETTKTYGGAKYNSNGFYDSSADGIIKKCNSVSTDFSNVKIGELLWTDGHVGMYIGNGVAIEATPSWKNCVQYTNVANMGKKSGNSRTWKKHGMLPWIEYIDETIIPDIIYAVQIGTRWLPEVTNQEDYAGIENNKITGFMVKLSDGTPLKYRVHTTDGKWLPYVTGYNKADYNNGYAGNGKVIDAVEIICDKYKIAYKVSSTSNGKAYYSEVVNDEDYAGVFGKPVDKLQCRVLK